MIYVTHEARHIIQRLYQEATSPGHYLRLTDIGHGAIGMTIGGRRDDDDLVDTGDGLALFMERRLSNSASGISLDAYDTPQGSRLIISRETIRQAHASVTVNWVTLPASMEKLTETR